MFESTPRREEICERFDYYGGIDRELAVRLVNEIDTALRYVAEFPSACAPIFEGFRHVVLPHFPYMLVYAAGSRVVNVIAVFPVRRDPAWMRRQLNGRPDAERP